MNAAPTVLDLFAGACCGWSLGLHRAGYQTVAACEIDPWRRGMVGRRFPAAVLYDDVRTLDATRLVRDLGRLPAVVVGSPPCQDASLANHRGLGIEGERTGLFAEFVRIVGEVRPQWFAAENGAHLRTRGLERVCSGLEREGYAVWPLVMAARNIGAPHVRERVWIIGAHADRDLEPGQPQHGEVAGLVGPHPWSEPWAAAAPRFLAVADGLPRGLAGRWARAVGDAVVPQIPEAIGRVMSRLAPCLS